MVAERRAHGFWKGFLAGLLVAVAGLLLLAWLHPPRPLPPPEVDPGALEAPAAPGQPDGLARPEPTAGQPAPAVAPERPQIADPPAADPALPRGLTDPQ